MLLNNRYKIEKVLGQGGMGKVYLALDTLKNRRIAVKQISIPGSAKDVDSFVARFKREYQFLSAIDHPNVIKAFDFFIAKRVPH